MHVITPFDAYYMFFGSAFSWAMVGEFLFRTIFLYLYALINIRWLGKRGLAQLSPFQLIIVFALGSAIGDPMVYQHVPLFYSMIVVTSIILLEKFTFYLTYKNRFLRGITEGNPVMVIKNGRILENELFDEGISLLDLLEMLREKGIKDTGQIEYAFLETSGNLSVIMNHQTENVHSTIDVVLNNENQ